MINDLATLICALTKLMTRIRKRQARSQKRSTIIKSCFKKLCDKLDSEVNVNDKQ